MQIVSVIIRVKLAIATVHASKTDILPTTTNNPIKTSSRRSSRGRLNKRAALPGVGQRLNGQRSRVLTVS
eukprot:178561-Prorocentrum_minimum.AAC.2